MIAPVSTYGHLHTAADQLQRQAKYQPMPGLRCCADRTKRRGTLATRVLAAVAFRA
jgi:hypothetical protein